MKTGIFERGTTAVALALALALGSAAAVAAEAARVAAIDAPRGTHAAKAGAAVKAAAASGGCISLKTSAEVEVSEQDASGNRSTRLAPATKVVPGDQVVWTITAANVCDGRAERVSIENPVPMHMTYVPESAAVPGAEVRYSLDGQRFDAPAALTVRDADGSARTARPEDYAAIRWTFSNPVAPGQVAIARFRAVLK